jgi:hypothetical protein
MTLREKHPSEPTKSLPVRLDSQTQDRLRRVAKQLGLCVSAVMRLSIVNQLSQIESGYIKLNEVR